MKKLIESNALRHSVSYHDGEWIQNQLNTALLNKGQVENTSRILFDLKLKQHEDAVKNWDNIQSLWHATNNTRYDEWIMDVAATPGSAFLPSLHGFGYQNLISINLTDGQPIVIDGVIYQHGDCTKTDFPYGHFGFISCLSVIEHGVDVDAFLRESARILKSGGYLFLSTDDWQDPVDTRGQFAFGVPVRIFTRGDMLDMIKFARSVGLFLHEEVNLDCQEKVVNWLGMDYTFVNLMFRKA